MIVKCPQCGQSLRCPDNGSTLTLRCPACRKEFKRETGAKGGGGGGIIFLIIVGLVLWWGYSKYQEQRERQARQRENDAAAAALLGGVINAVANGLGGEEPVARELRGADSGVRRNLDMPSGMSPVPSSVTVGPNGERYYNYDRVNPPQY
jgi:hypothetical protein